MQVHYQKHKKRQQAAIDFWMKVVADYNTGMTAQQIANRYMNPNTGRTYTREHIYWILKRVQEL